MIYILHFDVPYYHARHYVGFCADNSLERRLEQHRSGNGARLMAAIELAGIEWTVALTHPGDRKFERRLKRAKNTRRFCPLCRDQAP
jgi:predicted GIY-YIG superfamily endonuclease